MTTAGAAVPGLPVAAPVAPPVSGAVASSYRTERRKLAALLSTRLLALLCALGPFAFAAVLGAQSGSPADTLFGVWVHSSGFAVSLVVLGFAGSWGFPLVAGVLAGDIFSAEDRYGTWKTVLTRSCARRDVFAGKALAAMTFALGLLAITAVSGLAAGLLLVGDQSLVGLSGQLITPGRALVLVLAAWALTALPALAFASLAILFSLATRSGIAGVLGPAIVALLTQLLGLVGKGVWVHTLLIGSAFDLWHGLFTSPPFFGPLAVSAVVCALWIAICLGASWLLLRRRDFAGTHVGQRPGWVRPIRIVAVVIAVVAVLAVAGNWGPVGVTAGRLQSRLTAEFNNGSLYQQRLIGRVVPAGARLDLRPYCFRHSGPREGPGDWSCTLTVFVPQLGAVPFQQTVVTYDVSVQANGCYKAESPPSFVGQQTMRTARGHTVVNPLFVIYGCFDPL
jgi:ABC-2 type transport system permease protein